MLNKLIYSRETVREIDNVTITEHNIPGKLLMQKSGEFGFSCLKKYWPLANQIWIFCGDGNNAGDGFIVAKLAQDAGLKVTVIFCGAEEKLSLDARVAYTACYSKVNMVTKVDELKGSKPDLIVDALFGTGLKRELNKNWQEIIAYINDTNVDTLALDLPSGLNANTGLPMPIAVIAKVTATFVGLKQGLYLGKARDYVGRIEFSSLEIMQAIYNKVKHTAEILHLKSAKKVLPKISNCAHKNDFGHLLIVGGNYGMLGASILAAKAAFRAGVGLVTVLTRVQHANLIAVNCPEVMSFGVEDLSNYKALFSKATAVLVGPGLGSDNWAKKIFQQALSTQLPLIIDADGLNILATIFNEQIKLNSNTILTPHPGEAGRLLSVATNLIEDDRMLATSKLQKKFKCNIVVKGAGTIICDTQQHCYVCNDGNVGMATAGTGDILSGVISGLVARGVDSLAAAKLGVVVHSVAGDMEVAKGASGMVASDLLAHIRTLLN